MLHEILISGLDTVGKDSTRLVVNDHTAENDEDRRTVGCRCFSMRVGDHERCRGDHVDHAEDHGGQSAVHDVLGGLAVLFYILDLRINAVEEIHIDHDNDGKKDAGKCTDIRYGSAENFRKKKNQQRAGTYKQCCTKYTRYGDFSFVKLFHSSFLSFIH